MSIGSRIALKRVEKGITQTDLANEIGLKPASVSQYETGDRNPSYDRLIKIANALDTTVEFLLVGEEDQQGSSDAITKIINLALASFSMEEKKDIFTVMQRMAGITHQVTTFDKLPATPKRYARHLLKEMGFDSLPVDPFAVAERLNVRIIYSQQPLNIDGELIKGSGQSIMILDPSQHKARIQFTVAMLMGHLILPWHLRPRFYREKGRTSSEVDDPLGIEARKFADELLLPEHLILPKLKDVINNKQCVLQSLEKLAAEVNTSLTTLVIRFMECFPQDYVVLSTKEEKVVRKFADNKLIPVDEISQMSAAADMLRNLPGQKTFINKNIPEAVWFKNGRSDRTIVEEVVYSPQDISGSPQFLVLLRL